MLRLNKLVKVNLSKLLHNALELDLHYIPSRYPNAHPNSAPHEVYDEKIAENAIKNAKMIFKGIKVNLFEETNEKRGL